MSAPHASRAPKALVEGNAANALVYGVAFAIAVLKYSLLGERPKVLRVASFGSFINHNLSTPALSRPSKDVRAAS